MFKIHWKNLYSTVIFSSLTLISSLGFEGILNYTLAQNSTKIEKQFKFQSTENKQLNNRVGRLILVYKPSSKQLHQALQQALQQAGLFELIINGFNNSGLVMRSDIPVIFQDCGTPNAFYNPENKSIIMCHELIFQMKEDFVRAKKVTEKEAFLDSIYASIFVFYHELGHALIDVLPLPTVGKEEDAVDQFSAIILLNSESRELAINTILNAAIWFGSNPDVPAWDEHAPNDVRFYNLVCLIYGKDPNQYAVLEEVLPQQRAVRCGDEYNKVAASWSQLLLPHFAAGNKPWGGSNRAGTPNTAPRGVRPGRIW